MSDQRVLPSNLEAEKFLLGAILLQADIVGGLIDTLAPSDFLRPDHQLIFQAMIVMHEHGVAIDAVTVADHLTWQDPEHMQHLLECQNTGPSLSAYRRYVDIIIENSRRRLMINHFSELIGDCYSLGNDVEEILERADPKANRLIAPRSAAIAGLYGIEEFLTMARERNDHEPWLIPLMLKRRWRMIWVASEGGGKYTLFRQLGMHVAAGRDPFEPGKFIEPRRVLFVDGENPDDTIIEQHSVINRGVNLTKEAGDLAMLWHREGGINLRERRPRAEFEAVLQRSRPDIVFAGPLYKLFRKARGETDEQAAEDLASVFDDLRVRYNFALMLEHHAAKGEGGSFRKMAPFGSSLWMRWPEFGIALERTGNGENRDTYSMELGRFRDDRMPADWPASIARGGMFQQIAWSGFWPDGRGRRLNMKRDPIDHTWGPE